MDIVRFKSYILLFAFKLSRLFFVLPFPFLAYLFYYYFYDAFIIFVLDHLLQFCFCFFSDALGLMVYILNLPQFICQVMHFTYRVGLNPLQAFVLLLSYSQLHIINHVIHSCVCILALNCSLCFEGSKDKERNLTVNNICTGALLSFV